MRKYSIMKYKAFKRGFTNKNNILYGIDIPILKGKKNTRK